MDAFTSKITMNFIEQLKNPAYKITELSNYDGNRTVEYCENFLNWQMDIVEAVKENKKLFIFYPYVNKNNKFPSMKDLKEVLEKATSTKGVAYNAQTDDDILKQLKDVNSSWSKPDIRFVITNTKITVGVNYELADFDFVMLSIAGFNTPRDLIQVSMRCRHLKENLIKVVLLESQNTFNTYENDDIKVDNCPIYQNLVKDILIEKQAPLQNAFKYLAIKAGYKIRANNKIMRTNLESYFDQYYAECNLGYSYDTIPDIDEKQVEEINQKI